MTAKTKHLIIIVSVVAIARIVFGILLFNHNDYNVEESIASLDDYYEMAENIIEDRGFSTDTSPPYTPSPIRVPVYPYFLVGILTIFKSRLAIAIIQVLASILIPVLSYLIIRRIMPNTRIAFPTALFLAIEPYTILLSFTILTETIFTILWLGFVYVFFRFIEKKTYSLLILSALLFSITTMTRPNIQFLFFIILGFLWWILRHERKKVIICKLAIWAGIFVATISPWIYRNYVTFHTPTLSAHVSDNLYLYLIPSVLASDRHISFEKAKTALYTEEGIPDINEILKPDQGEKYKKRGIEILLDHPAALLKTLTITGVDFFIHDGYFDVLERFGYKPNFSSLQVLNGTAILIILGRGMWLLITVSFLVGAFLFIKAYPKNYLAWFALFFIVYFAGTTLIVGLGINARFRFSVNPFILMFAFYGARSLFSSSIVQNILNQGDHGNKSFSRPTKKP